MTKISEPGFYDIPAAEYHADPVVVPSLSSSIAKLLINKPPRYAWCKHPRLNPDFVPSDDEKFDLGSVVHELMLGKGSGFAVLQHGDWRTKAAQTARALYRSQGKTPILEEQFDRARSMAERANTLLEESQIRFAETERTAVWKVGDTWCRALIDAADLPNVYDIKTTFDLSDYALGKTIASLDYDLSAAFYLNGIEALVPDLAGRVMWTWIFIETVEPFEIRLIELDRTTRTMGDKKAAYAIDRWQRCTNAGEWPGYPRRLESVRYPIWAESQWLEREMEEETA